MSDKNQNLFTTKDFSTIVLLKHFGHRFENIEYEGRDRRTKRVYVRNTPELEKLLLEYENNELSVKAREWMRTIEETKEFVHR